MKDMNRLEEGIEKIPIDKDRPKERWIDPEEDP